MTNSGLEDATDSLAFHRGMRGTKPTATRRSALAAQSVVESVFSLVRLEFQQKLGVLCLKNGGAERHQKEEPSNHDNAHPRVVEEHSDQRDDCEEAADPTHNCKEDLRYWMEVEQQIEGATSHWSSSFLSLGFDRLIREVMAVATRRIRRFTAVSGSKKRRVSSIATFLICSISLFIFCLHDVQGETTMSRLRQPHVCIGMLMSGEMRARGSFGQRCLAG